MNQNTAPPLRLSVAIDDYLHTRALFDGRLQIAGIELSQVKLAPPQIFARFLAGEPWDVAEMSMGKLVALRSQGKDEFFVLPVFPHRVFRHGAFYVRADSTLTVEQLKGKQIGVPDWTLTAAIYARALLMHQYHVPLDQVSWVQAGIEAPRRLSSTPALPEGVQLHEALDTTLVQLLLDGEIDVMIAPHPPGAPAVSRLIKPLFADFAQRDEAYWRVTGLFPIMHTIVLRRSVEARHPGVARALTEAFSAARDAAFKQLADPAESMLPVPFLADHIERMRQQFKGDTWPYGIEANRPTLSAFVDFCFEQGVSSRRMTVDELFV